ncbi:MAG: cell division protein FtsZ, partial [Micrococcales bacterium]
GAERAIKATEMAAQSPLLDQTIDGAHGVLLSIQGGSNLGIHEINEAASLITEHVHPDANVIFGMSIDDTLGDEVRITVIAAGFDDNTLPYRKAERDIFASKAEPEQAAAPAPAAPVAEPAAAPATSWATEAAEEAATATAANPQVSPRSDNMWGDDLDIPEFLR